MLKDLLNQEGFRLTKQRRQILRLFEAGEEGQHLSAEEIQQQLFSQGEPISQSTIYRALHVMVQLGLLRELELASGKKSYELNAPYLGEHHHLVCVQCGEVKEFKAAMMTQVGLTQAASRGFALLDCQFTLYGTCPACQQSPPPA